jgi:uncharacterized damage-inducible protein DinB
MYMIDVVKVSEYSQYLRHEYLKKLKALPWKDVIRDRGASFGSLRNIYLHCISVLDFYNHFFKGEPSFQRINYDDFDSVEKISEYLEQVESEFNDFLSKLTREERSRKIERKYEDGSIVMATIEDYLFHIFQEETHHRGEFIALLWQMDVDPPHMGWNQYFNSVINPV